MEPIRLSLNTASEQKPTSGRGGTVGGDEENNGDEKSENEEMNDMEMVPYEATDPDKLVGAAQRSEELDNFFLESGEDEAKIQTLAEGNVSNEERRIVTIP